MAPRILPVLIPLLAVACTALKRDPVPAGMVDRAEIPGMSHVRWWADEEIPQLDAWLNRSEEDLAENFPALYGKEQHYLAISGGGSNGAYGAGVLVGMTDTGKRPEFTMVTGISTGALTAPFAFLGPKYDPILEEVYTTLSTKDLIKKRGLITALGSDAFVDTRRLRDMIAKYVTEGVVEEIAVEHKRGRSLFICTTNLDAGRPVIWSIGSIATSGSPDSLDLIRQVLLASASIPAAFPPVMIEVEADGKRFDEMHVDGGVTAQVFLHPGVLDFDAALKKMRAKGKPWVHVIRNGYLKAAHRAVDRKLLPVAGRSIDTMIQSQGQSDLYRIYLAALQDGMEYRQTSIPASFTRRPKELFDPEYMSALFRFGRESAKSGAAWKRHPPEVEIILEKRK